MKNKIYALTFLIISSFIASCSSDEVFDYKADLENSKNSWIEFKELSNNSYKYVTSGGSVFTTYGWETTITVSNGVIIERKFKFTPGAEDFIPVDELEWTENENEINSAEHETTSASVALTLDEIYEKSEQEWLIKRKNATSYFEAENNGLISKSGYVKKECLDDCFVGITIKSIKAL